MVYVCRAVYLQRFFSLVSAHFSALYVSFSGFFLRSDIPFSPFSPLFFEIGQGFVAFPGRCNPEYRGLKVIFYPIFYRRSYSTEVRSQKKWGKSRGKNTLLKNNTQKSQNLRTRSKQRGFTRPKQRWQVGCWLHQCVLRNTLAGSFWWFLCPGMSEIPYQRWPSSLNRGLEMCTVPTNLHGVGCSARPTSR